MKKYCYFFLIVPALLFAGDPIPLINITVEQSSSGIIKKGITNRSGEFVAKGLKGGNYIITLENNGKKVVIGKKKNDKVSMPNGTRGNLKPIRLDLSSYRNGNDIVLRKRPGRVKYNSKDSSTGTNNHNTVRTHVVDLRTNNTDNTINEGQLSERSTGKSYGSTRSNKQTISSKFGDEGIDNDCDGVVEITPMKGGKLIIKVICK